MDNKNSFENLPEDDENIDIEQFAIKHDRLIPPAERELRRQKWKKDHIRIKRKPKIIVPKPSDLGYGDSLENGGGTGGTNECS